MFNFRHYVPILKWKRAEQGALKALTEEHRKYITPLVQFVMPRHEPGEELEDVIAEFEKQAPQKAKKVIEIWGYDPIFVDISLLLTTPLQVESLNTILRTGYKLGGNFIPVIYLNDDQEIKKIACTLAKENKSGVCLRLTCSNFDFPDLTKLNQDIITFLSSSGLKEKDINLLVDIKKTKESGNKCAKYLNLSQRIPNLLKWRTFTFASGSFPENLSECKIDEDNFIARIDWKNWKNYVDNKKLRRKPAFADYTIQHPIYREDYQFFPPTTSIKYTLENEWLIMKGKKQKFDKYLASAALLVKTEKFYGESFSEGDKYIVEKANHYPKYMKAKDRGQDIKGTGSTETWLRTGINHHLALVANQIANLS
ncbi:MAG: beta family protein [Patescibacteria group bacterium]|nr:beta family protein [Patescibacteria group bacterium]